MNRERSKVSAAVLRACLALLGLGVGSLLHGQAVAAEWSIDTTQSRLTVKVLPAGLLASALHTHFFAPQDWSGEVAWDPNHPGDVRVGVRIAADSLRDHQPKLSARDVAKVEAQVRGAEILDAARFPRILFEATGLDGLELPSGASGQYRATLAGTLTLHGQSRPLRFPIQGHLSPERLEVSAAITFRQTDFGIKPYSTALGTIAVADEVTIEIALVAVHARLSAAPVALRPAAENFPRDPGVIRTTRPSLPKRPQPAASVRRLQ